MAQVQDGAKNVNFNMSEEDLNKLDSIVDIEGYNSRADAIRTLIRFRYEALFGITTVALGDGRTVVKVAQ